jgi:hypothetical protein
MRKMLKPFAGRGNRISLVNQRPIKVVCWLKYATFCLFHTFKKVKTGKTIHETTPLPPTAKAVEHE